MDFTFMFKVLMIFLVFAQVALVCLLTAFTGRWWVGPSVWAVLFTLDALYERSGFLVFAAVTSPPMWIAIIWMASKRKDRVGRVDAVARRIALFLGLAATVAAGATLYFFRR